ncbi:MULTISPECIES: hydroxyethylthiazole kinase [Commensalibacter]|uniref:Hydroxyethylthiazole kinase n=2 Tax=Commensalibacter TaxID=1079922 RepID=W7DL97_9PROT|nr:MULTISPECIES: hydroxyethylthiazole kinase [Commensalibacter]EUK18027.1 Hydroxyethylthiazole kinase [Commensalibacter papalotli (ex Servin-Garciduenas et al. 2014)]CAI3951064.1 Hydroxyethylthiazole kinase [Commensalibacter papalotli (ex Botero et al. 2024)]
MFTPIHVAQTLLKIRQNNPLIHNITNMVVMQFTANILLSLGASPAMINAKEEVQEFVQKAKALVINLGTISAPQAQAILLAVKTASEHQIPWVMDPVGVGACTYRSQIAVELLNYHPTTIRGNASEIIALYHYYTKQVTHHTGHGVDSKDQPEHALDAAKKLALSCQTIVSISGQTDYITNGHQTIQVKNGHVMMTKVTGVGCSASAITAACLAIEPDALAASAHAMVLIGTAGDIAMKQAKGPGSLQIALLDTLYLLNEEQLLHYAKIQLAKEG